MRAMLAYRALMERKGRLRALLDLSAPSPATLPSKRLHPPTSLLAECEIDFMSLDVVRSRRILQVCRGLLDEYPARIAC